MLHYIRHDVPMDEMIVKCKRCVLGPSRPDHARNLRLFLFLIHTLIFRDLIILCIVLATIIG